MDVKFFDFRERRIAHQTLLDAQNDLRNDFQIAFHEHVERVRDDAFGGIFHGHDAVIGGLFGDLGENVRDGFLRGIIQARAEFLDRGLMRERRFRPEIRDGHGLFERERAGHDFAVDRAQLFVRDRPGVVRANAFEHGAFAVRRINFLAGLELDFTDGEHVIGAFVEQPDDLRVQFINRLPMFGKVQSIGRMRKFAGRIKSVSMQATFRNSILRNQPKLLPISECQPKRRNLNCDVGRGRQIRAGLYE